MSPIGQQLHASEGPVNMSAWQASNHSHRREEHPIAGQSENQGYLALATHPSEATLVSKREHYSRLQNETIDRVPGTWRLSFPCIAWLPSDCFSFSLRPVQSIISDSGGISPAATSMHQKEQCFPITGVDHDPPATRGPGREGCAHCILVAHSYH